MPSTWNRRAAQREGCAGRLKRPASSNSIADPEKPLERAAYRAFVRPGASLRDPR